MAEKVTAGRDILGDFAPKFAELSLDPLEIVDECGSSAESGGSGEHP